MRHHKIKEEDLLHDIRLHPYHAVEPSNNVFVFSEYGRLGGLYFPNPFTTKISKIIDNATPFKTFFSAKRRNVVKQHGMPCIVHANDALSETMVGTTNYNPKINLEGNMMDLYNKVDSEMITYMSNKEENEHIPTDTLASNLLDEKKELFKRKNFNLHQGNNVDSFKCKDQDYIVYIRGPYRNHVAVGNSRRYNGKTVELDAELELEEPLYRVRCEEFTEDKKVKVLVNSVNKIFFIEISVHKEQINIKLMHAAQLPSQIVDARFPTQSNVYRIQEASVICLDGSVHVFDLSDGCQVETVKEKDLGHTFNTEKPHKSWKSVEYAASPQTMYVAYHDKVFLLDLRDEKPTMNLLWNIDVQYPKYKRIYSIKKHPTDIFHFAVTNSNGVSLMDQRYTKAPIFQWELNIKYPQRELQFIKYNDDDVIFSNGIDHTGNIHVMSYSHEEDHLQAYRPISLSSCKDMINPSNCAYKWTNECFYGMKVIKQGKNPYDETYSVYKLFQITEFGDLFTQSVSFGTAEFKSKVDFDQIRDPPDIVERFDEEEKAVIDREMMKGADLDNLSNHKQVLSEFVWDGISQVDTLTSDGKRNATNPPNFSTVVKEIIMKGLEVERGVCSAWHLWKRLRTERKYFSFEDFVRLMDDLCENEWKSKVRKRIVNEMTNQQMFFNKIGFMGNNSEWEKKLNKKYKHNYSLNLKGEENNAPINSEKQDVEEITRNKKIDEDERHWIQYELIKDVPIISIKAEVPHPDMRNRTVKAWKSLINFDEKPKFDSYMLQKQVDSSNTFDDFLDPFLEERPVKKQVYQEDPNLLPEVESFFIDDQSQPTPQKSQPNRPSGFQIPSFPSQDMTFNTPSQLSQKKKSTKKKTKIISTPFSSSQPSAPIVRPDIPSQTPMRSNFETPSQSSQKLKIFKEKSTQLTPNTQATPSQVSHLDFSWVSLDEPPPTPTPSSQSSRKKKKDGF